jgi:hypothetical protein
LRPFLSHHWIRTETQPTRNGEIPMARKFAASFKPRRTFAPRPVRPARPAAPAPLPAAVVDAVLRFHDEAHDQGCGRSLLRLSLRRLGEPEVRSALGDLAVRAANVAILWNEREGEIIRVLEAADARLAA